MSRGEGELLTVPKPRAVRVLSVYLAVKPVGEPDAGDRHVRFDERGWETERWPFGPKLPRPSSILPKRKSLIGRGLSAAGGRPDAAAGHFDGGF